FESTVGFYWKVNYEIHFHDNSLATVDDGWDQYVLDKGSYELDANNKPKRTLDQSTGLPIASGVLLNGSAKKILTPQTGTTSASTATVTSLTDTSSLAPRMNVWGTNIIPDAVIATVDSATQITLARSSSTSTGNNKTGTAPVYFAMLLRFKPNV